MAQIGQFTREESGYSGRIRTLSLDFALVFVPVDKTDVENAPDYRIRLGDEDGVEIGAGWLQTGDRAGAYVSVVLDDPSFVQPIRARLFQADENGRDWGLHWTRPRKRDEQDKAQD
ncbi:conserved hypothetical protein [Mesorhizobium plurifarium]|uniref:DUF736 domain-containing protein n=1 Tax=Mesorhizobium plurifarium TaxID=69974 RepID=A0A090E4F5_MESPL|nr:conserved hypothetical protein [Mesorhizobium plurifarium]